MIRHLTIKHICLYYLLLFQTWFLLLIEFQEIRILWCAVWYISWLNLFHRSINLIRKNILICIFYACVIWRVLVWCIMALIWYKQRANIYKNQKQLLSAEWINLIKISTALSKNQLQEMLKSITPYNVVNML